MQGNTISALECEEDGVKKSNLSFKKQVLASSIGGSIAVLFVTPLDVIKTRVQAQKSSQKNQNYKFYSASIDAFRKILNEEGIKSLWRGVYPGMFMTIPSTTLYFSGYKKISSILLEYFDSGSEFRYFIPMVAGSLSRILAVSLTTPLDLIRTNIQSHSRNISASELFVNIFKSGRFSTFWIGFSPTLWRDVPFSALYWTSYEYIRSNHLSQYTFDSFLAGAISGTLASAITTPFDVAKTRIQMNVDKMVIQSLDLESKKKYLNDHNIVSNIDESVNNNNNNNNNKTTTSKTTGSNINTNFRDGVNNSINNSYPNNTSEFFNSHSSKTNANSSMAFNNSYTNYKDSPGTNITGVFDTMKYMVRNEGFSSLFKGILPRVIKVAPACAIMVSTYEFFAENIFKDF